MPEETENTNELRKYLLGDIDAEVGKTVIEEKLMTSDDYFQELLIEEEELVQDYVDGHLSPAEEKSFTENYLISDEKRQKVKFAEAFRAVISEKAGEPKEVKEEKKNEPASFWRQMFARPIPLAVGILLILAVSLTIWTLYFRASENNEVIASLNKAYSKERPFESRVTGLEYAKPRPTTRGKESENFDKIEAENARNIAVKAASENPDAVNLNALGRVYLTERRFDEAITQFEKALRLAPNNARSHSDLGAAWSEKGKNSTEKRMEAFGKAIEEFDKAISLDKSLAEAYFNKALCLQLMRAPNQAKAAWEEYLRIDPSSRWAEEARKHLQALGAQKTSFKTKDEMLADFLAAYRRKDREASWQMLSRNREMVTGKLIPQQLAFSFSATKKRELLEALVYAGDLEFERTRDPFWKNLAAFYRTASADRLDKLSKAHDLMTQGYNSSAKGINKYGLDQYAEARRIFVENESELEANIATLWVGFSQYVRTDLEQSKETLKPLVDYCKKKDYRWLLSHVLFWVGVNYGSNKQNSKAIEYYQDSLRASESVFDDYNSQKILSETAEEYRLVGRANVSLDYLEKSLRLSDYPETSLRQKSRTYENLIRAFYSLKSYQTALVYEKENILLLAEIEDIAFHQISNIQLGQILAAQKKYDDALNALEKSRERAESMQDEGQKRNYQAMISLQIAHIQRETGDCRRALANYSDAIEFHDSGTYKARQYDAHKGRLLCYLELKDGENFDSELITVLKIFEDNRAKILDEQTRNVFFNNEQTVYDLAIDYEFGRGNAETAFDYSERSRSRSLLDLVKHGARIESFESNLEVRLKNVAEPLSLTDLRKELPAQVEIVQYAVLQDRVLIWLVSKDDFQTVSSPIKSADLNEKVSSYLKLVSRDDESAAAERTRLSRELYELLIKPVIARTNPDKEICLIPDKSLLQLPFASLLSPDGKFLVQERSLLYAPSANIFLVFTKHAERLGNNTNETVLSIGNPAFDQNKFANLENLEPAESEATEIARFYQNPKILLTKYASKENVKAKLADNDVIHFAGHYLVNESLPLHSSLILADNGQENSNLANYELIGEDLSNTKLVVLSACRTNAESYYHGEGLIGASRTFLATGIPLVVASQWSVETNATAELMIKFHRYRKGENLSTTRALRQAQLDLINGPDERYKSPYYWSPFITLGGYSRF